jgi:hypothetical protein
MVRLITAGVNEADRGNADWPAQQRILVKVRRAASLPFAPAHV